MSNQPFDHSLTPYNRRELGPPNWPQDVLISDCTLRDGEQQAGLVLSKDNKLKIAGLLVDLGVYEIEAGMPTVSQEDFEAVSQIAASFPVKVSALARAVKADIDSVAAAGAWGVRISLPAGMLQLKYKLGISEDEYLEKALSITEYAKEKGLYVVFSPFDTTRAEEAFLRRVVRSVGRTGTADRFRLVDTTGSATPNAIDYLVRLMQEEGNGVPIEVHVHDDFGLATANTLAGVRAGAQYVSLTINGLGERAGNASLEQVATALELLHDVKTGIRLEKLTSVSRAVSWLTRTFLPPNTPIVGTNAFAREAGLAVGGMLKDPRLGEPFPAETVGQRLRIVIGKKSGSASIRAGLERLGLQADEAEVASILKAVKNRSVLLERALDDDEFREIASQIV